MSHSDTVIVIKGNTAVHDGYEIKLKKYIRIDEQVALLKAKKKELERSYFVSFQQMLMDKKVDKSAFNTIVTELRAIDAQIDGLIRMKHSDNLMENGAKAELEKMTKETIVEDRDKRDRQVARKIAKDFKTKVVLYQDAKSSESFLRNEFIKEPLEKTKLTQADKKTDKKKAKVKEVKPVKPDKQEKPVKPDHVAGPSNRPDGKRLSPEQKDKIKTNIKELLKRVYRFKDKSECISKQRSKPYFVSKDEIIAEIEKYPDLKNLMPSNYKKLNKEDLCEYLFKE